MDILFIQYPKCSTCQTAKKWLCDNGISHTERNIKEENPTFEELCAWYTQSGIELRKYFNTSGLIYKAQNLKEKLPEMSETEQLSLLASDGMLVKRPIIVSGGKVLLLGFKEELWAKALIK